MGRRPKAKLKQLTVNSTVYLFVFGDLQILTLFTSGYAIPKGGTELKYDFATEGNSYNTQALNAGKYNISYNSYMKFCNIAVGWHKFGYKIDLNLLFKPNFRMILRNVY